MYELLFDQIDSPVGKLLLAVKGDRLCTLDFSGYEERMRLLLQKRYGEVTLRAVSDPCGYSSRLRAYFAGDLRCVDEIPVETGGTSFQQQVWLALRTIPAGTVTTYGTLSTQLLGNGNGSRAVGITNSLNPIAIVLPCHRVVGANHELTGYAGGLERKRWLLAHEGVELPPKSKQRPAAELVQGALFG
jgi:methylated-DNA-[protein]-cysteine S-methyltransferase